MPPDTQALAQQIWDAIEPIGDAIVESEMKLGKPAVADLGQVAKDAYIGVLEAKDSTRRGWVAIDRGPAIVLAGLLLQRPAAAIEENVGAGELVGDDFDAIAEFVNQFISPINDVLKSSLEEQLHFVLKDSLVDGSISPEQAETVAFHSELSPADLASGSLHFFLPREPFGLELPNPAVPVEGGADSPAAEAEPEAPEDKERPEKSAAADADESPLGVDLTPEELEAIREATRSSGSGRTLLVATVAREADSWKSKFSEHEIEIELASDFAGLSRLLRSGEFETVVVDADACPAGGLPVLAKLRDANIPSLVVAVVVSEPTKSHLVGCIAAGAKMYLKKPIAPQALVDALGSASFSM